VFYAQLEILCKNMGTTVTTVTRELGYSKGNLSHWKQGNCPGGDIVVRFADYFNVTTDYLLGRTSNSTIATPQDANIKSVGRERQGIAHDGDVINNDYKMEDKKMVIRDVIEKMNITEEEKKTVETFFAGLDQLRAYSNIAKGVLSQISELLKEKLNEPETRKIIEGLCRFGEPPSEKDLEYFQFQALRSLEQKEMLNDLVEKKVEEMLEKKLSTLSDNQLIPKNKIGS